VNVRAACAADIKQAGSLTLKESCMLSMLMLRKYRAIDLAQGPRILSYAANAAS
jgi:hypothetical protein